MAKVTKTTARGIAGYTHLNEPDTKYVAEGVYHVKLRLPAEDALPMIEEFQKLQQDAAKQAKVDQAEIAKKKGKKMKPIKLSEDNPWSEMDDGSYEFNFKMKASGVSKKTGKNWSRTPAIFDIHGTAIKNPPNIGAGSVLRVAYTAEGFYTALVGAGVTLRLEGVKLIKLVEYSGSASASALGFDEEEEDVEDGFEAGEEHLTAPAKPAVTEDEDEDEVDGEDGEDPDFDDEDEGL